MQKILLVDDSKFIRFQVKLILKKANYHIIEAATGTEALALFKEHNPTFIFLDINLPDISGIDLLSQFIQMKPETSIVMLTGSDNQDLIMDALQKGAVDFIAKDGTLKDALLNALNNHL